MMMTMMTMPFFLLVENWKTCEMIFPYLCLRGGDRKPTGSFFWQVDAEHLHLLAMHVIFSKKNKGSNVALLVKSYSAIEAVAQLPSGTKG